MKRMITLVALVVVTASQCACTEYHARGAGTGAVIGGVAGALLDHRNPWRGGVIGAGLGALAGATITEISLQGSRQAVTSGRPVEYYTEDRRGRYYAEPASGPYYYDSGRTKCRKIHERVWEDGRLVKDQVREVCESERYEGGYDRERGYNRGY